MHRGLFSSLSAHQAYHSNEKDWMVELDRYHRYWYDLVVNPNEVAEYFDTRSLIVDYLSSIKKEIEAHLEKRFVYFICSRERVRFNVKKTPTYNPLTKKMKIHILVGEKNKKRSFTCQFVERASGKRFKPSVNITEKYITLKDASGDLFTYSIHDFLEQTNTSLGLDSRVEYVGFTKNPHTRPTNGSHTGLSDVLHQLAEEKRDSLIYFNTFRVYACAKNNKYNLNFTFANAMTNEIDAELEGKIIEKCFIFYFDAKNQTRNKEKERKELESSLAKIAHENKINAIHINYDVEEGNEYTLFSSSHVSASPRHVFTVKQEDDGVKIIPGSTLFDELSGGYG
ncbi:hypothetical protein [Pantoea sp.]|uniref:hypothetical protein n=1 Tax=Pantoea sp. TaxID=69393 RepID=UPI0031D921EC